MWKLKIIILVQNKKMERNFLNSQALLGKSFLVQKYLLFPLSKNFCYKTLLNDKKDVEAFVKGRVPSSWWDIKDNYQLAIHLKIIYLTFYASFGTKFTQFDLSTRLVLLAGIFHLYKVHWITQNASQKNNHLHLS